MSPAAKAILPRCSAVSQHVWSAASVLMVTARREAYSALAYAAFASARARERPVLRPRNSSRHHRARSVPDVPLS